MNARRLPSFGRRVLLAGCLVLGGGCLGDRTRVSTVAEPAVNLEGYRTFAFLPEEDLEAREGGAVGGALRRAVHGELAVKGYVPAPSGGADLLVSCFVDLTAPPDAASRQYSDMRWRAAHVAPDDVGPPGPEDAWEVGTFDDPRQYVGVSAVVDVVDARSGELVWRGWARRRSDPQELDASEMGEVTRAVLEAFPERGDRP